MIKVNTLVAIKKILINGVLNGASVIKKRTL